MSPAQAARATAELDVLLDKGVYKLQDIRRQGPAGQAVLKAEGYRELSAPAPLAIDHPFSGDLGHSIAALLIDVGAAARHRARKRRSRPAGHAPVAATARISSISRRISRPSKRRPAAAMMRVRLEGKVESGRYLVTAYGGENRVWPDRRRRAPVHDPPDRRRQPRRGPRGKYDRRLRFVAVEGLTEFDSASNSRNPRRSSSKVLAAAQASSRPASQRTAASVCERETRRAMARRPQSSKSPASKARRSACAVFPRLGDLRIAGAGPTSVFVDVAGEGGDEIPATALLVRFEQNRAGARLGWPEDRRGQAWRRRFNLRGASTILFEMTSAGPERSHARPRRARCRGARAGSRRRAPTAVRPRSTIFEAGLYQLRLTPVNIPAGGARSHLGQPGLVPEAKPAPAPRWPCRSACTRSSAGGN